MKPIYAHGKLLLSSEYMVLYGSSALAVPLTYGQSLLRIEKLKPGRFSWSAYYKKKAWFHATFHPGSLKILATSDQDKAERLIGMIRAAIEISPIFQEDLFKWDIETHLEFSPEWGMGSSSTLIALLAEWAEVNPLDLHFSVSAGSGYDVACAFAPGPILYKLRDNAPHYQHIPFHPPFADQIYFVWQGSKQPTESHIRETRTRFVPHYDDIHHFTLLTEQMIETKDLDTFGSLITDHESRLSELLGMDTVSSKRFPDLNGYVKSLGAWGGDIALIVSREEEGKLKKYLQRNGINQYFRYRDLVYEEG